MIVALNLLDWTEKHAHSKTILFQAPIFQLIGSLIDNLHRYPLDFS